MDLDTSSINLIVALFKRFKCGIVEDFNFSLYTSLNMYHI